MTSSPCGATACLLLLLTVALAPTSSLAKAKHHHSPAEWVNWGNSHPNTNSRFQPRETVLTAQAVQKHGLMEAFRVQTGTDVSATPLIKTIGRKSVMYFGDYKGTLYAINARTGAMMWNKTIRADYLPEVQGYNTSIPITRNTPIFYNLNGRSVIIFGLSTSSVVMPGPFAYLTAVDANDGSLVWKTLVSDNIWAVMTQSPVIYKDAVYVGLSSNEESIAASFGYVCCTFRGSFSKYDARTGHVVWTTYTTPAAPQGQPQSDGYSGNSVWASSASFGVDSNLVYITTGNNYNVPNDTKNCVALAGSNLSAVRACQSPDNWADSLLALDMATGDIKYGMRLMDSDVWTAACLFGLKSCPVNPGPDYDFGAGPMHIKGLQCGNETRDMLILGQKSGIVWGFDASVADPASPYIPPGSTLPGFKHLWSAVVGPGSSLGGIEWGMAYDGKHIFAQVANGFHHPIVLVNPAPGAPNTTTEGLAAALDPCTGDIVWNHAPIGNNVLFGPPSAAKGVVYYGALNDAGSVYALKASSGELLAEFDLGKPIGGGSAIANGRIYIGSGYARLKGTHGDHLSVLTLNKTTKI